MIEKERERERKREKEGERGRKREKERERERMIEKELIFIAFYLKLTASGMPIIPEMVQMAAMTTAAFVFLKLSSQKS